MEIRSECAPRRKKVSLPKVTAQKCIAVFTTALAALTMTIGCAPQETQLAAPENPVTTLPIPPNLPPAALPSDIPPVPLPSDIPHVQLPNDIPRVQLPSDIPRVELPADIPPVPLPSDIPPIPFP